MGWPSYMGSVLFARAPVLGLCFGVSVTQGLLPSVAVLGCGLSLPVCGVVRIRNGQEP